MKEGEEGDGMEGKGGQEIDGKGGRIEGAFGERIQGENKKMTGKERKVPVLFITC